jgi:hypothetical protein
VGLEQTYHQAEITGMDICLLKPFAVSCSKDMSVRVWNYVEHCCEIVKYFPSEALSISLHPTGTQSIFLTFVLPYVDLDICLSSKLRIPVMLLAVIM